MEYLRSVLGSPVKRWGLVILAAAALLFWLFNVSRPASRPAGCLQECAAPADTPPTAGDPLRIITWNILHGFPDFSDLTRRLDLIATTLQEHAADVILLQEASHTPREGNAAAYLAERLDMNYVYARANGNRRAIFFEEGSAILSRFPLAHPRVWELAPQAGFFEHRIVVSASVLAPHGPLTFYATHLTNGDPADNQAQAAHLQRIVSESCTGLCFIGGDFNALPGSLQIAALTERWQDTAAQADGAPGHTCCLDLDAPALAQLSKRIDYLFLASDRPDQAEILEVQTIPSAVPLSLGQPDPWASDHLGVLTVVRLPQPGR